VFLDLGRPKVHDSAATQGDDLVVIDANTPKEQALLTDVYAELKRKLVARGVADHETRFVHDARTREARSRLFQAANDGTARVIVGSTQKLATGANVQKRLAALHHLDAPWRPMDIEQREGRGLRQGNEVYGPCSTTRGHSSTRDEESASSCTSQSAALTDTSGRRSRRRHAASRRCYAGL
jgi:hypothetical protein